MYGRCYEINAAACNVLYSFTIKIVGYMKLKSLQYMLGSGIALRLLMMDSSEVREQSLRRINIGKGLREHMACYLVAKN
jgi:hypothetical protein